MYAIVLVFLSGLLYFNMVFAASCPFVNETEELLSTMQKEFVEAARVLGMINQDIIRVEEATKVVYSQEEADLAWVTFAQQTSPSVKIVNIHGRFFVGRRDGSSRFYEIFPGDHNLWVDSRDVFCGFDKTGSMFCHPAHSGYNLSWLQGVSVEELPQPKDHYHF